MKDVMAEDGSDFSYLFDEDGNIKNFSDPYRSDRKTNEIHTVVFDEEGFLTANFNQWLTRYIKTRSLWSPECTAMQLYHAEIFAGNTKGNYPTVYYWR